MDNGFIRFNNFRVGKEAMLNKFWSVEDDGTYKTEIKSKTNRLAFLLQTLTFSRIHIALGAAVRTSPL